MAESICSRGDWTWPLCCKREASAEGRGCGRGAFFLESAFPRDSQVAVGVAEKLEIGGHNFEIPGGKALGFADFAESGRGLRFEGDDGINANFPRRDAHQFLDGLFVEFIAELIFVNENQIRNQGEIELAIGERGLRQFASDVMLGVGCEILEESLAGAGAIGPHAKRSFVEVPFVNWFVTDLAGDFFEVVFATCANINGRCRINAIERGDIKPKSARFSGKGTDAGGDVENCFAAPLLQFESERALIFIERAPEKHHAIKVQSLFLRHIQFLKIASGR